MAKYKIVVRQTIEEVREVEADSLEELNTKLEDQGQFIGRCVKPAHSTGLIGRIHSEDGQSLGTIIF